ncbi:MAG: 6-phosphogluconolactonase [Pseudomonadota bacterium]
MSTRSNPTIERFATREEATSALSGVMAVAIERAVGADRRAWLCLSGGSSPVSLFRTLGRQTLPWGSVDLTLSDERWVPVDHADSNEALVRRELLQGPGAAARLHGLYREQPAPEDAVDAVNRHFATLDEPFDYCLLGMGADGHTASLFPDATNLAALLSEREAAAAVYVPRLSQPRITLSPPRLLASREIGLLLFGDEKLIVLERAMGGDDPAELPVRCVLQQARVPVTCYWAP